MVDYIFQLAYLKPVPNLQTDTYNQITYMNNNFGVNPLTSLYLPIKW